MFYLCWDANRASAHKSPHSAFVSYSPAVHQKGHWINTLVCGNAINMNKGRRFALLFLCHSLNQYLQACILTGLNPLDQRSTVLGGIDQINTGLIQSNGVTGCQNTDVMHIRLGRITITVTIHTQSVHDIDINDLSIQSVYHSEETIPIEIFLMAPPYPAIE